MIKLIAKIQSKNKLFLSVALSLLIVLTYPSVIESGIINKAPETLARIKSNLLAKINSLRTNRRSDIVVPTKEDEQTPILYPTTIAQVRETPPQTTISQSAPSLIPSLVPTQRIMSPTPIINRSNEIQTIPGIYSYVDNITNTGYIRTTKQATLVPITLSLPNGGTIEVYDIR